MDGAFSCWTSGEADVLLSAVFNTRDDNMIGNYRTERERWSTIWCEFGKHDTGSRITCSLELIVTTV